MLATLPRWDTPMIGAITLLPGLWVIFPTLRRKVPKKERAGWIDVRINSQRVRVLFQFGGQWNNQMIRNLKPNRLAQLVSRAFHRTLLEAKINGRFDLSDTVSIEHFIVKGLLFEEHVGLSTDYIVY